MTTLTKLGIQGIRSFSNERMESLEFERPVTLIVGHNGAGKTTIIECLKMATCGQLPPNCDKGHGFIHDPNVAGVPEVKGQIRLLFRTGLNHQAVCATRTFQLTNTRTKTGPKATFKALENLLRFKDQSGDNNRGNRRCADMDTAIPSLMGVPRSILEHVIFCHQEDSNWPLGERIALKKRFDEIFGSSRYTKALETIDKQRKDLAKEAKEKAHVLALISKDREVARDLRRERHNHTTTLSGLQSRISDLDGMIVRKESELEEIEKKICENREISLKIESLNREIARLSDGSLSTLPSVSECETKLADLQLILSNLEESRMTISRSLSDEKSSFESLVKERNDTSLQLRTLRASRTESSNIHDLLRLKAAELVDAVDSARSSQYLPHTFVFDHEVPANSIRVMEELVAARAGEGERDLGSLREQLAGEERRIRAFEEGFNSAQNDKFQTQSELTSVTNRLQAGNVELSDLSLRLDQLTVTARGLNPAMAVSGAELNQTVAVEVRNVQDQLDSLEMRRRLLDSSGNVAAVLKDLRGEIFGHLDEGVTDEAALEVLRGRAKILRSAAVGASSVDELVSVEKRIGRIEIFKKVIASIDNRVDRVSGDVGSATELDQDITRLTELRRQLSLLSESVRQCMSRIKEVEVRVAEMRNRESELVVLLDARVNSVADWSTKVNNGRAAVAAVTARLREEQTKIDSSLHAMRNSFHLIFTVLTQLGSLREKQKLESTGGESRLVEEEIARLEITESEVGRKTSLALKSMTEKEAQMDVILGEVKKVEAEKCAWSDKLRVALLQAELGQLGGSGQGVAEMNGLHSKLSAEVRELRDSRSLQQGEANQISQQLAEVDRKLGVSALQDVDEKYRQAVCVAENYQVVCKDVQRYHQALDRALMNYHVQKMDQINQVIRDLWEKVYRGTDIDFIAIRSDSVETDEDGVAVAAATVGGPKRSYNYRVVMVKGDVELEMRGRCSAGQKVVASLIIRLALAETFCLSCGILALDEPTTNLDRSNIGGLAEALAELIASRREQRNFQLIIITHDESFVRMLGRLRACDHFYRIAKDHLGHSTIARAAIYELNTR